MEKEILTVLRYFSFFDYSPTLEEIYTFLKKKSRKRHLTSILLKMEKQRLIKTQKSKGTNKRYTLGEYSNRAQIYEKRRKISQNKIQKILSYVRILSLFPQIKLIGLSGSVGMFNAGEDHDIDLFIITAKDRLWTGRFLALALSQILGLRRKRQEKSYKNKVCLNLFIDESDLAVPKGKKTEYVAHEILQMKPLVQKEESYVRFIDANRWVFDIFPNARAPVIPTRQKAERNPVSDYLLSPPSNLFEFIFKKLQLFFINRHKTTEIITDTQLWFHPEDFEKKLKRHRQIF